MQPTELELHPDTKCPTTRLRFPVAEHSMRLRAVYTCEPTGNHTTHNELKVRITLAHPESPQYQIVPDILLSLLMIRCSASGPLLSRATAATIQAAVLLADMAFTMRVGSPNAVPDILHVHCHERPPPRIFSGLTPQDDDVTREMDH